MHRRYGYVPRKGAVGQVEAGNKNAINVETPFVSKNGCLEPIGASDVSVDEWNGYLPAANFYLPMIEIDGKGLMGGLLDVRSPSSVVGDPDLNPFNDVILGRTFDCEAILE